MQANRLKELYAENSHDRSHARIIAADMPGNWTHSQISKHIKLLGLREPNKVFMPTKVLRVDYTKNWQLRQYIVLPVWTGQSS